MDNSYDIIIVGGGILGTFHAYHALLAGKKVLHFEKDNFPVGSTVRNFGQVVPSGMEGVWFEYGCRSTELYKSIQAKADISVRQNGSVYIASDPDEQTLIHELKAHYDKLGYACELLSQSALQQSYPALNPTYALEGLFFAQEVSVEPDQMISKLHQYLKADFKHYTLQYNAAVVACETKNGGVEIRLSTGEMFKAAKAVICNGYEFKLLFPEYFANSGIVVSKLQMMRTQPMPEVALEGNILTGLTTRRYESFEYHCPSFKSIQTPAHYEELKKWGIHILFKKASDGSFIIGDSHEYAAVNHIDDLGFNLNQYINELMLREAARIVNFEVSNIQHYWAGYYPQHPDKHIVTLDLEDKIHIRTAIGGKGMTASAGYAEQSMKDMLA